jgi:endonuclease/exonuclease/phosphatase family metal-dependent hydrolase
MLVGMADRTQPSDSSPRVHQGVGRRPEFDGRRQLLVVTWNVQFGIEVEAAATALTTHPALRGADVVLLQEMDEVGTQSIAESIDVDWVFSALGPHRKTGRNFGNAVLSRWPLRQPDSWEVPHKSAIQGQARLVVGAIADLGPHDVAACSAHAEVPSLSPPRRREQFAGIAEATKRWQSPRLIAGGDFNTLTERGVNAVDRAMGAVDATRVSAGAETSLRRAGREFPLDHVFARGFDSIDRGVVTGLAASDHRPLWVRLTW